MADAFSVMQQAARAPPRKRKRASDAEIQSQIVQSASEACAVAATLTEDDTVIDRTLVRGGRTHQSRRAGKCDRRARAPVERQVAPERPGALTFERCEHMLVAMAYFGLSAEHSFLNIIFGRDPPAAMAAERALLKEGMYWVDACRAYNIISYPSLNLMETLGELAAAPNPAGAITVYRNLHEYMKMMLSVCSFSTAPVPTDTRGPCQCAISAKPIKQTDKPADRLLCVEVKLYNPRVDAQGDDYRQVIPLSSRPLVFHVTARYSVILFGTWYFYHLPILVGANCATWVAWARTLPVARRNAEFPGIATMSDAALARLFVERTRDNCMAMFRQIVFIAQTIEKRNQEYRKQLA